MVSAGDKLKQVRCPACGRYIALRGAALQRHRNPANQVCYGSKKTLAGLIDPHGECTNCRRWLRIVIQTGLVWHHLDPATKRKCGGAGRKPRSPWADQPAARPLRQVILQPPHR